MPQDCLVFMEDPVSLSFKFFNTTDAVPLLNPATGLLASNLMS